MQRAKTLPQDEQDALAEEMGAWLDEPMLSGDFDDEASDAELARRVSAWEANPVGMPAAQVHARLKARREQKRSFTRRTPMRTSIGCTFGC